MIIGAKALFWWYLGLGYLVDDGRVAQNGRRTHGKETQCLTGSSLGASEDPNKYGGITSGDIVACHRPECVRDVIGSVGQIDAVAHYPALGIFPGVVLVDPKLRHRDPALSRM